MTVSSSWKGVIKEPSKTSNLTCDRGDGDVTVSGYGMVVVGVIVGVVAGIMVLVIVVFAIYKRKMKKDTRKAAAELKTLEEKKFVTNYAAFSEKPKPDGNTPISYMVNLVRGEFYFILFFHFFSDLLTIKSQKSTL